MFHMNLSDSVRICLSHLMRHNVEPFFDKLITGDESGFFTRILEVNLSFLSYCKLGTSPEAVPKPSTTSTA